MPTLTLDTEKCTTCGLCAKDCPALVWAQEDTGELPTQIAPQMCLSCGHCVAICPAGAITIDDCDETRIGPIDTAMLPGADQVFELIRARRSIRNFKDEPVAKEIAERIVDAAHFAPTAHNCQSNAYVVVLDRETLDKVIDLTVDFYAKLSKKLHNPVSNTLLGLLAGKEIKAARKMLPELDMFLAAARDGKDIILRGAQCLIIFHGAARAPYSEVNANLALQNATLMCEALDLGSFYTGFVVRACKRDDRIPKLLGIPEGNAIHGGMALGHPSFRFSNWIRRQPARVTWM